MSPSLPIRVLAAAMMLAAPCAVWAAWPADPLLNVPVCTAAGAQESPVVVSDGQGGAIIVWRDDRNGALDPDIYAQRVSADGAVLWTANGVPVCAVTGRQQLPQAVSDGAGGAIVVWRDERNGAGARDIFAQRISPAGARLWATSGVAVCDTIYSQDDPRLVADGAGGAIVVWFDNRGIGADIYGQRLSANGVSQWAEDGIPLCVAPYSEVSPRIASDGSGGAVVTWTRSTNNGDIHAQRVSAGGALLWTADGVAVCAYADIQEAPTVASDDAGGAFFAWRDRRGGAFNYQVYVQHVSAGGSPLWTSNGVPLSPAPGGADQAFPVLAHDGSQGVVAAWSDFRNFGSAYDIYAQRLDASGLPLWTTVGTVLSDADGDQRDPAMVLDGAGRAICAWSDGRVPGNRNIAAQRFTSAGAALWIADGEDLTTAPGPQETPAIVSDGVGGAIVAWRDLRNSDYDIYAQRILAGGALGGDPLVDVPGGESASLALEVLTPNPSRDRHLSVQCSVPGAGLMVVELLDVAGRRVAVHEQFAGGSGRHRFVLTAPEGSGLYFVRLSHGDSRRVARRVVLE